MSPDRMIPERVDLVLTEMVLDEEPSSMDPRQPKATGLTREERDIRAKVVSDHVAHLEQIPTADLSTAAMRRLTLVAIAVLGADPLGGQQTQTLGSEHHPVPEVYKSRSTRRRSESVGRVAAKKAVRRGRSSGQ
jgi:hypothetical protein